MKANPEFSVFLEESRNYSYEKYYPLLWRHRAWRYRPHRWCVLPEQYYCRLPPHARVYRFWHWSCAVDHWHCWRSCCEAGIVE